MAHAGKELGLGPIGVGGSAHFVKGEERILLGAEH